MNLRARERERESKDNVKVFGMEKVMETIIFGRDSRGQNSRVAVRKYVSIHTHRVLKGL